MSCTAARRSRVSRQAASGCISRISASTRPQAGESKPRRHCRWTCAQRSSAARRSAGRAEQVGSGGDAAAPHLLMPPPAAAPDATRPARPRGSIIRRTSQARITGRLVRRMKWRGGDGAFSRRPRPARNWMRAPLTMAVDVHFAALEEPLAVHSTQVVFVTPQRGERKFPILDVIIIEIARSGSVLAIEPKRDIAHHVYDLGAAHRFLVLRGELEQALRALMASKNRAFEDAVLGKAPDPLFEPVVIDRERITRV